MSLKLRVSVGGASPVVLAHLGTIPNEVEGKLRGMVAQAGWAVHNDIKGKMGGDGTPSKPGGYPGVRTGKLKGSLNLRMEDGGLRAVIGESAFYAVYLEKGTSKMAARPHLKPSLESQGEIFIANVRAMIAGIT